MAEKKEFVHLSDGEKAVCKATTGTATMDEQAVECPKCIKWMSDKAAKAEDPIINVRVLNKDLDEGVDWNLTLKLPGWKEVRKFRLINGEVHRLPQSVADHLSLISYPFKRYVKDADSGNSMQIAGKYHRFMVTRVGD